MDAVDVVKAAFKAIEDRDWVAIDHLISDELQFVGPMPQPIGKAEFIGLHRAMLAAFPNWRFNPTDLTGSGSRVDGYVQVGGTQSGALSLPGMPPIPATGKTVLNPREPLHFEVKDGNIARIESDPVPGGGVPGLISQLGVVTHQ